MSDDSSDQPGDDPGHDPGATRAIFQALVLTACVDGRPEVSEADVVRELLTLDPRFTTLSSDAFELGVQARALLGKEGVEDALEKLAAPITSSADHALAFRLCARVMIADGKTEGDEAMVLGTLQERFGLSHATVVAILEDERKRRSATAK
jgi:tellurite resistance protein